MKLISVLSLLGALTSFSVGSSCIENAGFEMIPNEVLSTSIFPRLCFLTLTYFSSTCKFLQNAICPFVKAKYYCGDKLLVEVLYEDYLAEPENLMMGKIKSEIEDMKDGTDDGLLDYLKVSLFSNGPMKQAPYYDKKRLNLIKLLLKHKTFESPSNFVHEFLHKNVKEVLPHIQQPLSFEIPLDYVVFSKRLDPEVLEFVIRDYPDCELRCSDDIINLPLKAYKNPITIALFLRLAKDTNYEHVLDILELSQVTNSVSAFLLKFINKRINKNLVLGIFKRFRMPNVRASHLLLLCAENGYAKEAHMLLRGEDIVRNHLEMIKTRTITFERPEESDLILETALINVDDEDELFDLIVDFELEDSVHHLALASYCGKSPAFLMRLTAHFPFIYDMINGLKISASVAPGLGLTRIHKVEFPVEVVHAISERCRGKDQKGLSFFDWAHFVPDQTLRNLMRYEVDICGATLYMLVSGLIFRDKPESLKTLLSIHIERRAYLVMTRLEPIQRENVRLLAMKILKECCEENSDLYKDLENGRDLESTGISLRLHSQEK